MHLPLDKPARGRYTMDNRIEQPSSGGRMLPAEIGRTDALTREPDTDHAVVGKDADFTSALLPRTVCSADF